MKFNHVGIPTTERFDGEIDLPQLKMTVSDHENNPFGIQWQRYWKDAPYPEIVKSIPHVAFEVDNLNEAIKGHKIIIEPNSPSAGLMVAFIEINGAPVELMQYDKNT
ncbi:VOC family protein [Terasakiella pusilla]|uniref:VOC family protein n=1 Tax=Terasakiella pusilla TaxID=64973 RepID=UPI003AA91E82